MVPLLLALAIITACAGDKPPEGSEPLVAPTTPKDDGPATLATPPTGWSEFTVEGNSFWLPGVFEGGNIKDDRDRVIELFRSLGPACAATADTVTNAPGYSRLMIVDSSQCGTGDFVTNVAVGVEEVPRGVSPGDYLEGAINFLPRSFDVVEQGVVTIGEREGVRLVIEAMLGGISLSQLYVALPTDDSYWIVVFTTSPEDFDERRSEFELAALTFENSLPD
jgi:hypothetical protein